MHILIVHGYLLDASGSCTYVRNLAKGFNSQGHKVTVACQDDKYKSDKFDVFCPLKKNTEELLPVYVYNPYEGYKAKLITEMTENEVEHHIEKVSDALAYFLLENNIDFIFTNHCLFSPVNVNRALKKSKKNIPYVCKIHGSALNFTVADNLKRWIPYVSEGLDNAQKVICGSNYMKERFEQLLGTRYVVDVIPCGVDTKLFSSGEREPFKERIIYCGNILDTKGIAELLTIYPHLKYHYPNLQLYIAGKGTYVPNLNAMLEAMRDGDVEKYVEWARKDNFIDPSIDVFRNFMQQSIDDIKILGYIDHETLKEELSKADIMIAPSKAPEAFGLVTIESMAAGVYPVVSNHSGLKNVIDIIESSDSEISSGMRIHFDNDKIDLANMTSAIMYALEYVKYNNPSERLKAIAQSFDWKNICENILKK